jgi:hypothetical protein
VDEAKKEAVKTHPHHQCDLKHENLHYVHTPGLAFSTSFFHFLTPFLVRRSVGWLDWVDQSLVRLTMMMMAMVVVVVLMIV